MYEIVSDLSGRQDHLEDRLTSIEEKIAVIHEQLEGLPEVINQCFSSHLDPPQQKQQNLLRPDSALPHSKSGPTSSVISNRTIQAPLPPPTSRTTAPP